MNKPLSSKYGFSVFTLLVIVTVCIMLIASGVFGVYKINRNNQINSAIEYSNYIVSSISKGDSASIFESDIKLENKSSDNNQINLYNWVTWAYYANEAGILTDKKPSLVYENNSFLGLSKKNTYAKATYSTGTSDSIFFELKPNNNSWVVTSYGIQ